MRRIGRRERAFLLAVALLAAVRVWLFGAAFPLFNNVDEKAHFDLVHRYASGSFPRQCTPPYDPRSTEIIAAYSSPEYLFGPSDFPDRLIPPPLWSHPSEEAASRTKQGAEFMRSYRNGEACSPPVYYLAAGLWYDLGKALGIRNGGLAYWVRFLNVPNIVALVWLSSLWGRRFYPEDPFFRIAAPLLVAFFPQDVFFSINSDVPSALLSGLSLYFLARIMSEDLGAPAHAWTGLLFALSMLTKISNLALAPLAAAGAVLGIVRAGRLGRRWQGLGRAGALLATAFLPVLCWMARNSLQHGDPLGTREKIAKLGWTLLPLLDRWRNRIFTPQGAADFAVETTRSFWRGEFSWYRPALASTAVDGVYVASSFLFLTITLGALVVLRNRIPAPARVAGYIAGAAILLFLAFLVWASIRFDYGTCWYPSRDRPYLRSGRLMLGALVPFVLLYLDGLRRALARLGGSVIPLAVVVALVLLSLGSEIVLSAPAFVSAYNWFHLP